MLVSFYLNILTIIFSPLYLNHVAPPPRPDIGLEQRPRSRRVDRHDPRSFLAVKFQHLRAVVDLVAVAEAEIVVPGLQMELDDSEFDKSVHCVVAVDGDVVWTILIVLVVVWVRWSRVKMSDGTG